MHPTVNRLRRFETDLIELRRHLHRHPELSWQEYATSDLVAAKLAEWGIEVHRGLGGTGVVGTLKSDKPGRTIGIRADMDALPIQESSGQPWQSQVPGVMHACGHDGHTAMLLGAARYLAEHRNFNGTVHFVFQPAEEKDAGARKMVEDGLFKLFPMEAIFAMHNQPDMQLGALAVRPGPVMAGSTVFDIDIHGIGTHAARPHKGVDPIVAAAHVVIALQSIVSRNVDPLESAVLTIGVIQGGNVHNVVPQKVSLSGTMRYFKPEVRDLMEPRISAVATHTAAAFGARAEVTLSRGYPPTTNHEQEAEWARQAAVALLGEENVILDKPPSMGAEDFSYMLQQVPGAYVYIGNGPGEGGCLLHNPNYDFNDANLTVGAAYWVTLVERLLAG